MNISENMEKLLPLLKARLNSSGKVKSTDSHGNVTYVDHDIYTKETLVSFLDLSLSEFNQTPDFTNWSFESPHIMQFAEILVEGASIYALASQALIERGREFQTTSNGIIINPPNMSDALTTQYATFLAHHWMKLQVIKKNIKSLK